MSRPQTAKDRLICSPIAKRHDLTPSRDGDNNDLSPYGPVETTTPASASDEEDALDGSKTPEGDKDANTNPACDENGDLD